MHANNRNYWFKSGSYNLILNIQSLVFGFGGFYLLLRTLDKHSFGVWTLFVATTTIFEMARNGLIQNALIKFLSHSSEEESPGILSASFFLSGVLMIACIIVNISIAGYLARLWHYPGLATMFYAYNVVYLLQGILSQFQWIEQANLSFKGVLVTSTIRQGGFFFYVLACFVFHFNTSLMHLIYAQAICAFSGLLVEYFFIKKYLSFSFRLEKAWIKKLFDFGKYVFATSISGIITTTVSQMMLGALLSPEAAGAYNVAAKIISLTEIPTNSLVVIVFPQSSRRFANEGRDAIKYLYEKSVGALLSFLIPSLLFLFLFPGFVVHIIAGGNYGETIPLIKVSILSCLLNPFSRLFGTILDSIGKPKVNFIIITLFTVVELLLNFVMIKGYGIMGAVYATLVANIIFFAVMQVILRKELRVNFLNTFIYAKRFYPELINNYLKPIFKR
jgi:lipopolysaccharide exporter